MAARTVYYESNNRGCSCDRCCDVACKPLALCCRGVGRLWDSLSSTCRRIDRRSASVMFPREAKARTKAAVSRARILRQHLTSMRQASMPAHRAPQISACDICQERVRDRCCRPIGNAVNEFFDAVWFGVVKYIKAVRTVLYYLLLWPLLRVWRQLGRLSDWIDRLPCTERLGSAVERGCMRCGRGCAWCFDRFSWRRFRNSADFLFRITIVALVHWCYSDNANARVWQPLLRSRPVRAVIAIGLGVRRASVWSWEQITTFGYWVWDRVIMPPFKACHRARVNWRRRRRRGIAQRDYSLHVPECLEEVFVTEEQDVMEVVGQHHVQRQTAGAGVLQRFMYFSVKLQNDNDFLCNAHITMDGKSVAIVRVDALSAVKVERSLESSEHFRFLGKTLRAPEHTSSCRIDVVFVPCVTPAYNRFLLEQRSKERQLHANWVRLATLIASTKATQGHSLSRGIHALLPTISAMAADDSTVHMPAAMIREDKRHMADLNAFSKTPFFREHTAEAKAGDRGDLKRQPSLARPLSQVSAWYAPGEKKKPRLESKQNFGYAMQYVEDQGNAVRLTLQLWTPARNGTSTKGAGSKLKSA